MIHLGGVSSCYIYLGDTLKNHATLSNMLNYFKEIKLYFCFGLFVMAKVQYEFSA